jgi:hypothetical protein
MATGSLMRLERRCPHLLQIPQIHQHVIIIAVCKDHLAPGQADGLMHNAAGERRADDPIEGFCAAAKGMADAVSG